MKIVIIVWYTQCATYSTVCILSCTRPSRLPNLFNLLSATKMSLATGQHTKKNVRCFLVAFIVLLLANVAFLLYLLIQDNANSFTEVLYSPFSTHHILVKIVLIPTHILCFAAWFLPLALYCIVSDICELQLESISKQLDGKIAAKQDVCSYFESLRREHVHMSDVIQCMDKIYSGFTALSYATNVPLGCFVLYMIIWPENDDVIYMTLFSTFVLLMALCYVVIVSHKAASLVAMVCRIVKHYLLIS